MGKKLRRRRLRLGCSISAKAAASVLLRQDDADADADADADFLARYVNYDWEDARDRNLRDGRESYFRSRS